MPPMVQPQRQYGAVTGAWHGPLPTPHSTDIERERQRVIREMQQAQVGGGTTPPPVAGGPGVIPPGPTPIDAGGPGPFAVNPTRTLPPMVGTEPPRLPPVNPAGSGGSTRWRLNPLNSSGQGLTSEIEARGKPADMTEDGWQEYLNRVRAGFGGQTNLNSLMSYKKPEPFNRQQYMQDLHNKQTAYNRDPYNGQRLMEYIQKNGTAYGFRDQQQAQALPPGASATAASATGMVMPPSQAQAPAQAPVSAPAQGQQPMFSPQPQQQAGPAMVQPRQKPLYGSF